MPPRTPMHSVTATECQVVMQNSTTHFLYSKLKGCRSTIMKNGLPRGFSGGFAVVYRTALVSQEIVALRLFTLYGDDAVVRYKGVHEFLSQNGGEYFVKFEFIPHAVLIRGVHHPAIIMDWVDGKSLLEFVENNLKNKSALVDLYIKVKNLFLYIKNLKMAHGDLSHTNIIVDNKRNGLKLIDYDGMYCNQTEKIPSPETGIPHYQHPERDTSCYGVDMDNFSMWIILASIQIVIEDHRYFSGKDCLVFTSVDISNPKKSKLFSDLLSDNNAVIRYVANFISGMASSPYRSIPNLTVKNLDLFAAQNDFFVPSNKSLLGLIKTAANNQIADAANWRESHKIGVGGRETIFSNPLGIPNWKSFIKKK